MKTTKELFSLKNIFLTIVFIGTLIAFIFYNNEMDNGDNRTGYFIRYTLNVILLGAISLISFYSLLK